MHVETRGRKPGAAGKRPAFRKAKMPSSSLHGNAVQVSVDERLEQLLLRFPALRPSLGSLIQQGKKRIRDLPLQEQERILRMVFALKKASRA